MEKFTLFLPIEKSIDGSVETVVENSSGESKTRYKIKGIASTNSVDRDNEVVSKGCLKSMAESINKKKLPIFGNHDHNWENMLGYTNEATSKSDKLEIGILTGYEDVNPKVKQLVSNLKAGFPYGLSIGGRVLKYGDKLGKDVRVIEEVDLLETSIVGIGANPDAFLSLPEQISKSLKFGSDVNSNTTSVVNGMSSGIVQSTSVPGSELGILPTYAVSVQTIKSAGQAGEASYGKLGETTVESMCPHCGQRSEFREIKDAMALYVCYSCGTKFAVEVTSKQNVADPKSNAVAPGSKTIDQQVQETLPKELPKNAKTDRGVMMVETDLEKGLPQGGERTKEGPEAQGEDDEYKRFMTHMRRYMKEAAEGITTTPGGENSSPKNGINGKSVSEYDAMRKAFKDNIGPEGLAKASEKVEKQEDFSFAAMRSKMVKGMR